MRRTSANTARMVSTLCAYANDLMVMPSTYIAGTPELVQDFLLRLVLLLRRELKLLFVLLVARETSLQ